MSKKAWIIGLLIGIVISTTLTVSYHIKVCRKIPIVIIDSSQNQVICSTLISNFKLDTVRADILSREILYSAQRFKVDWQKIVSIIRIESNFDPFAIGKHGEIGLMQCMPGTASILAKELNLNFNPDYLFNEHYAIIIGTYCIAQRELIFNWNFEKAVRAYQAGVQGYYRGDSDDEHWKKIKDIYESIR